MTHEYKANESGNTVLVTSHGTFHHGDAVVTVGESEEYRRVRERKEAIKQRYCPMRRSFCNSSCAFLNDENACTVALDRKPVIGAMCPHSGMLCKQECPMLVDGVCKL